MGGEILLDSFGDARQIGVERALGEFRAGRPVAIRSEASAILAFPVEGLTEKIMPLFQQGQRDPRLIVPGEKIRAVVNWDEAAAAVRLAPFTLETIGAYLDYHQTGSHEGARIYGAELAAPDKSETAALGLAKLSLLLPAAIVADASGAGLDRLPVLSVVAQDVFSFRDDRAKRLEIVARTFVPLEGAGRCEFIVFRGGDGFRDQIAVTVSDPSPLNPVLARIHSACLTGDLFGSLKCDCGDQLRGSVRAMSEQGGGVLLYLDQEGRGNGIANKIRAYCLQEQGLDTYDADRSLGFGKDQRRFGFAADMLKMLGYKSIRLITNNPQKISALRDAGLEVVSIHRVLTRPTPQNAKYLAAKRDKAGHMLGAPAPDGLDLEGLILPSAPQS